MVSVQIVSNLSLFSHYCLTIVSDIVSHKNKHKKKTYKHTYTHTHCDTICTGDILVSMQKSFQGCSPARRPRPLCRAKFFQTLIESNRSEIGCWWKFIYNTLSRNEYLMEKTFPAFLAAGQNVKILFSFRTVKTHKKSPRSRIFQNFQ